MWFALTLILACGPKKSPADSVVPSSELSGNSTAPTETKGIRSVEVLGQINLNSEFEGLKTDTLMRFRRLTIEPGGVVAQHEHQQRPGVAYIVSGTIQEHRDGTARSCQPGDVAYEASGITHWWENQSEADVVAIVVDIIQPESMPDLGNYLSIAQAGEIPSANQGLQLSVLGAQPLFSEFSALKDKSLRVRHIDVAPEGVVAFHTHHSRPSFAYLLSGEMTEHRDDRSEPIRHHAGSVVTERNGLGHWWQNETGVDARFLVVDIVDVDP